MKRDFLVFSDLTLLARAARDLIVAQAQAAVAAHRHFYWMISGGKTPSGLFAAMAETTEAVLPWSQTEVFWADERMVPPGHADSNYGLAHALLLSRVPLPTSQVHRIESERGASAAADHYVAQLRDLAVRQGRKPSEPPVFDTVVLGVGSDGHTASLFPDSPLLDSKRWAAVAHAPPGIVPNERVTVTLSILNSSRCALFLAAGREKSAIVRTIQSVAAAAPPVVPAARVRASERTVWLLDEAAAAH